MLLWRNLTFLCQRIQAAGFSDFFPPVWWQMWKPSLVCFKRIWSLERSEMFIRALWESELLSLVKFILLEEEELDWVMSKPKHILCWDTFAKDKQTTRHYFYVGFVPAIELCTNGSQVTGTETWHWTASLPILQVLFQIGFNLLGKDCVCCSFINWRNIYKCI